MQIQAAESHETKIKQVKYEREIKVRRVLIWLVLSLAYLIAMFHRVAPAVIVDKLFLLFHIEAAAAIGSLAAVYFYVYFLMQIPAGLLVDALGAKKVVVSGMIAAAIGSVWFGLADDLTSLFIGRFMVGLGVSVIFISLLRVYTFWFRADEFGTALGLTIFLGNLGTVLATTPLAVIINSIGWRSAFVIVGLFSLLIALLSWFIIRNEPQDANLKASSENIVSWLIIKRNILQVICDRHLWLALAVSFSIYGPLMALAGVWGVPYLMQVYGLGRSEAATFVTMVSFGIMLGSFSIGIISDRLRSRKKPYLAFAIGNMFVWGVLAGWNQGVPPLPSLYVLFFLLGFFGNSVILSAVMVKEYNPPSITGVASGIGNIGGFIGSSFMQPFFGLLMDHRWDGVYMEGVKFYYSESYQLAFGACFLFGCLAVVAAALLRESFGK